MRLADDRSIGEAPFDACNWSREMTLASRSTRTGFFEMTANGRSESSQSACAQRKGSSHASGRRQRGHASKCRNSVISTSAIDSESNGTGQRSGGLSPTPPCGNLAGALREIQASPNSDTPFAAREKSIPAGRQVAVSVAAWLVPEEETHWMIDHGKPPGLMGSAVSTGRTEVACAESLFRFWGTYSLALRCQGDRRKSPVWSPTTKAQFGAKNRL